MSQWQLEMFGDLRLFHDPQNKVHLYTRKTEALLAYLALFSHTAHPREHLASLLWETSGTREARNSLSVSLHALRSVLELKEETTQPVLLADRMTLRLDATRLTTDVARFEQALRDAAVSSDDEHKLACLRDALACYRGPLLPAFYEDWIITERNRLELRAHEGMRQAARLLAKQNELRPALEYALRASAVVPLHEPNCRDVIRLYTALGNPQEALAYYRAFAQRLQDEMRTAPAPATVALAEQLTRNSVAPTLIPSHFVPPAAALDRFFGREAERELLEAWLQAEKDNTESAALITLTGMGGVGKTRLAKEVTRRGADWFGTNLHFFNLAEETEPARLMETLCLALRLPRAAETTPLDQLADVLGTSPALLVLDNFEQLVEGGDLQVQVLRERIPNLTLLLTSRQRLNVAGERELTLLPLPLPVLDANENPASLETFACIQLFVDRCRQHQDKFTLTAQNAATIAQICARLEGLPLALELAAAWSRVLSPPQMLAQLQKRFDLLVSTRRDLPDRHRSLRATVEGSYRLLSPELQHFFTRLAVFAGGWTLEAAQKVCGEEALVRLAALQDASLIVTEQDGEGTTRFRLLETLREFAAEQLSAEQWKAVQESHAAYFAAFAAEGSLPLYGPDALLWCERLEAEHDNFQAILTRCFSHEDAPQEAKQANAERGIRLTAVLVRFWCLRGYLSEGQYWQKTAFEAADFATPEVRAVLYRNIYDGYPPEVFPLLAEKILSLGEMLQNRPLMARAKIIRANAAHIEQRFTDALLFVEEAIALLKDTDRRDLLGQALNIRAVLYRNLERPEYASAFDEALAVLRQSGDALQLIRGLTDAAFYLHGPGARERAEALLEESLELCRTTGHRTGRAHGLWLLGKNVRGRDLQRAEACFQESLALHRRYGFMNSKSLPLSELGYTALLKEEYHAAREFFLEANMGLPPEVTQDHHRMLMLCAVGAGDTPEFLRCCDEHLRLMPDTDTALQDVRTMQIFATVLVGDWNAALPLYTELVALWKRNTALNAPPSFYIAAAHWVAAEGHSQTAARLLGAEVSFRKKHGLLRFPIESNLITQTEALLRAALPESEFAALYAEGRAMNDTTRRDFLFALLPAVPTVPPAP